jgi:hypothetical protein
MCPIPRGRGAGSGRLDVQSDAPPKIRSEPATERRSEVAEDSISAGRGGWPEPGMKTPTNRRSATAWTKRCSAPTLECCSEGPPHSRAATTGGEIGAELKSSGNCCDGGRQVQGRARPRLKVAMTAAMVAMREGDL